MKNILIFIFCSFVLFGCATSGYESGIMEESVSETIPTSLSMVKKQLSENIYRETDSLVIQPLSHAYSFFSEEEIMAGKAITHLRKCWDGNFDAWFIKHKAKLMNYPAFTLKKYELQTRIDVSLIEDTSFALSEHEYFLALFTLIGQQSDGGPGMLEVGGFTNIIYLKQGSTIRAAWGNWYASPELMENSESSWYFHLVQGEQFWGPHNVVLGKAG